MVGDARADRAAAGDDYASHARTISATASRSSSPRPRSGARTPGRIGTPRSARAVFEAARNGNRWSEARRAAAALARLGRRLPDERHDGVREARRRARRPHRPHRRRGRGTISASGADEDVEPVEEIRLDALPRRVGDLHPGEVVAPLAQPLEHLERHGVAAARGELVDVERQRRARGRGRLEVDVQLLGVEREVRRRDHGDRVGADLGGVLGELDGVGGRLRAAVHGDLEPSGGRRRGRARRRACARPTSKRTPSPVVPRARIPSSPWPARKSRYGPNASASRSPPPVSGVRAAARAPRSIAMHSKLDLRAGRICRARRGHASRWIQASSRVVANVRIERDGAVLRITLAQPDRRNAFDAATDRGARRGVRQRRPGTGGRARGRGQELLRRRRRRLDARVGRPLLRGERRRRERAAGDARGDRRLPGAGRGTGAGARARRRRRPRRRGGRRDRGAGRGVRVLGGEARDRPGGDLAVRAREDRPRRRRGAGSSPASASTPRPRCGSGSSTRSRPISTRAVERVVAELLSAGPLAVRWAKRLVRERPDGPETARWIAERRTSDEGQEGLRAFLERRPPSWRAD